ncbi:MAG: DUF5658 family protein [Acidobacteriota bacterium]|jgi:hypothetical protein
MKNNLYRSPPTGKILLERRSGQDRRARSSIFPLSYIGPPRRKRGGRRVGDTGYVDIYDFRTLGLAAAVVLLSFMDAVLTHQHLINGSAREANPIMQAVIRFGGIPAFYGAKGFLTLAAVVIILLHKEWALGRYAARFCLWAYIALSLYHLYLVSIVSGIFV